MSFAPNPAFAIDLLKLTTGQTIVGEVSSETADYVDFHLENGPVKRIPRTAIASLEKDIPLPKPANSTPGRPLGFVSLEAGGAFVNSNSDANRILFDHGIGAGFHLGQIENFQFTLAASYHQLAITKTLLEGVFLRNAYNDLNFEFLFSLANYPELYFGPNVGVMFRSVTIDDVDTGASGRSLEVGASFGYAYLFKNTPLSIGPLFRFDHVIGPASLNLLKLNAVLALHF